MQVPGEPLRATFSRANDYLDVDLGPGPGYGPLAKFHRADVRVTKDAYVVTAWVRRERSLRGSGHLDGYMMTGRIRLPGPIGDRAVIDASGRKRIVVPPGSREALRRLVRKYRMTDARAGVD